MRIRALAVGLAWTAASLWSQSRFSWQDYCFKNPASPVCRGNDYAIKPPPPARNTSPRSVVTSPVPSTRQTAAPTVIVLGKIDWRFAEPFADALVGLNFSGLSGSPLVRNLIAQLGARQGLSETDVQRIFDGLSDVDQLAFSVRNNRIVVMVTGHIANSDLPATEPGLKAVPVSGNAILFGHSDAVDQAIQRIGMKGPPAEWMRQAEALQAGSEFWATGSAALLGPQAMSAGVKRFSLSVSIGDRLTSDLAFEFSRLPRADSLKTWQTEFGATTLEGNTVHVRTSMAAEEAQQKFAGIVAGPLGAPLAAMVEAARYLPVREAVSPKPMHPVIYGLDGGPKEVNPDPNH